VNKLLLGTDAGKLLLWNFKSGKLVYTFEGWGAPVNCLQQSPALDVVACGLSDGRIVLHNLKLGQEVMVLRHASASVNAVSFRTDTATTLPLMVSGDSSGAIAVWDLNKKRLVSILKVSVVCCWLRGC
jgi:U3 small nucleolar RNA-associated protein 21